MWRGINALLGKGVQYHGLKADNVLLGPWLLDEFQHSTLLEHPMHHRKSYITISPFTLRPPCQIPLLIFQASDSIHIHDPTHITTHEQVSEHPQHEHVSLHQGFLMGFGLTIEIAEGALLAGILALSLFLIRSSECGLRPNISLLMDWIQSVLNGNVIIWCREWD